MRISEVEFLEMTICHITFFSKELNTSKVLQKRQKTKAFVKHKEDKIRYNIFFSNVQVA